MAEKDPWHEYRRRRNLSLLSLVGFVPALVIFGAASYRLFGITTPGIMAAFAWMIFAVIAGNWFIRFRCPRCGKPFFADSKWWGYNTFVRRCLHCKLALHAPIVNE